MSAYAVSTSASAFSRTRVVWRGRRAPRRRGLRRRSAESVVAVIFLVLLARLLGVGVPGLPGLGPIQGTSAPFSATSDNARQHVPGRGYVWLRAADPQPVLVR